MKKYIDMTVQIVIKFLQKYLKSSCTKCKKEGDQIDSARLTGVGLCSWMYAKIEDSSRDSVLRIFLAEGEMKAYEVQKQLCWVAEDPIKHKNQLDKEYVTDRKNTDKPNFDLFKAGLFSLLYFTQEFSLHASLDEISCKVDSQSNSTLIRIPMKIPCIGDLIRQGVDTDVELKTDSTWTPWHRKFNARVDAMAFEVFKKDYSVEDDF